MKPSKALLLLVIVLLSSAFLAAQNKGSSVKIVFKDHHEQTLSSSDVSRIDLSDDVLIVNRHGREEKIPLSQIANIEVQSNAASAAAFGRGHFVGKWKVGLDSNTSRSFEIDLQPDGKARKSIDSGRGTWTFVDGTARITWEDGWRDVIAQVGGNKYEKRAFAPGKSLSDPPANVTVARRNNDNSI